VNRRHLVFALVATLVAAFFRFYRLETVPPGLWYDEAVNGIDALRALDSGDFRVFYPGNNGREGLFINCQALLLGYLPNQAWTLRCVGALFGTLTVLGTYLFTAALLDPGDAGRRGDARGARLVAFFAAIFMATSFWQVVVSRLGVRPVLAPCCLVWAFYLFFRGLHAEGGRASALFAVLGGAVYGLGFHSYLAFRATPLLLVLLVPLFRREARFWRVALLFGAVASLAASPLASYFLEHPEHFFRRMSQASSLGDAEPLRALAQNLWRALSQLFLEGSRIPRHNLLGNPQLYWPISVLMGLGLAVQLNAAIRGRLRGSMESGGAIASPRAVVLLLVWFLIGLIPAVLARPGATRYLLSAIPIFVFAGIGAAALYRCGAALGSPALRGALPFAVAVALLLLAGRSYRFYFHEWALDARTRDGFQAHVTEVVRFLEQLPPEKRKVVVRANRGAYRLTPAVRFLTRSYSRETERAANLHFVAADKLSAESDSVVVYLDRKRWWIQEE
jgi:hypothetical protein